MKYRTLGTGSDGIRARARLHADGGVGEMAIGAATSRSTRTIHRAIELGVTFFDTAEVYGPYLNEELLGRAIGGQRDGLVIATKFGLPSNGMTATGLDGARPMRGAPCEGSLKRLGTDTIDLYYQHRVDPDVPIEDTVGAMAELVREGKVRDLGLSEAAAETIRRAHGSPDRGAAIRIFAVGARRGERDPAAPPRESASASCRISRSGAVS